MAGNAGVVERIMEGKGFSGWVAKSPQPSVVIELYRMQARNVPNGQMHHAVAHLGACKSSGAPGSSQGFCLFKTLARGKESVFVGVPILELGVVSLRRFFKPRRTETALQV